MMETVARDGRVGARRLAGGLLALALGGCTANYPVETVHGGLDGHGGGVLVMRDGAALPYRAWLPAPAPAIVVLALHGFNDSEDAWEIPGPAFAAAGIGVIAPDERGFGAAPERGRWPGTGTMVDDAAQMARLVQARYPRARLYLMGESMGGAVLMALAASPNAPAVAGYVFSAPAVWGWGQMNLLLRASLWLADGIAPGMVLDPGPVRVKASDNRAALIRLGRDPRTLLDTRVAAVRGLVDLMSAAQRAAPQLSVRALFLYGGHDELVPKAAMAEAWRKVAAHDGQARLAYYVPDYHLLQRDLERATPVGDIIAWLQNPAAPLPSGADLAGTAWLEQQSHATKASAPPQTQLQTSSRDP